MTFLAISFAMAAWAWQVGHANPLTLETVIKPVTPNTGEISPSTEWNIFDPVTFTTNANGGVTPNAEKDNGVTPNADTTGNLNAVIPNKAVNVKPLRKLNGDGTIGGRGKGTGEHTKEGLRQGEFWPWLGKK